MAAVRQQKRSLLLKQWSSCAGDLLLLAARFSKPGVVDLAADSTISWRISEYSAVILYR